jgi:type IV pilus assembly protein PilM
LNEALPRAVEGKGAAVPDPRQFPFDQQQALHIDYIEDEYFADLKTWWANKVVQDKFGQLQKALHEVPDPEPAAPADPAAPPPMGPAATPPATKAPAKPETGPTGPGWVIEISGYHFFNAQKDTSGSAHLRRTLLRHLDSGTIELPGEPGAPPVEFTMKELGIGYPILAYDPYLVDVNIPNPFAEPDTGASGMPSSSMSPTSAPMGFGIPSARPGDAKGKEKEKKSKEDEAKNPKTFLAKQYKFRVQFCWQERTLAERLEKRAKEEKEAAGKAPPPAAPPAK